MDQYSSRIQKIEAVLEKLLPENPGADWAREVFSDLEKIPDPQMLRCLSLPCRDLLSRGGKRWRPLLMALVCETLGGGDSALPLAPLAELCHNASLIHDDIEDNSDERRGKPAVHILYGTDTAINSGSFLYFLPLACIESWAAGLPTAFSVETLASAAYSLWGAYMRRLHLGQAMDIAWHRDFSSLPAIEDYRVMCTLKTGCLARFSAVLGVYAATAVNDAAAKQKNALAKLFGEAAENLGVGFQIIDDVKNLSEGMPGKKRGDDIVEGKKSLPVLMYLHRYPGQREFVSRCFAAARSGGAGSGEAEELIQAIDSAGILAQAREQGMELISRARDAFANASADFPLCEESRALLAGLPGLIS